VHEVTIHIDAPREVVWRQLMDVERWPEWTASISSAEPLDGAPLALGHRVRIKQPKMPAMVWRVSELEPERSFAWTAKSGGVETTAVHQLLDASTGGVSVRLAIDERGPLAPLARLLVGRLGRRYVQMEAEGLKRRAEGG
jgi:uncharacterized protein YndB with AHSA1/START domain